MIAESTSTQVGTDGVLGSANAILPRINWFVMHLQRCVGIPFHAR